MGRAAIPSGASAGEMTVELRDGDPQRYLGKGVPSGGQCHARNPPAILGMDAFDQQGLDRMLVEPGWYAE